MAEVGDRVRLGDGQFGTVGSERAHESVHVLVPRGRGRIEVRAYPVVLDSGEVKFFKLDALEVVEPQSD